MILRLIGLLLAVLLASAQTDVKRTPEQLKATYAAHQADFDYLLGDWEFTGRSQEYGPIGGRWSAVRLDTGQILDEYRVMSDSGETYYATSTIRSYNAAADRWELIGMDTGGSGLQDFGTAHRVGAEMHIEQRYGVASGKIAQFRFRYYNIQADHFSWSADRTSDRGKTWVKEFQQLAVRRIDPSRKLGPLVQMGPSQHGK